MGRIQAERFTIDKLTEAINNSNYFTFDGFKQFISNKESNSQFINLCEIEIFAISGDMETAAYYNNYRNEYRSKQEQKERQEYAEREQKQNEREEAEIKVIDDKLTEAERKILNHETIYNEDIQETTLLLMLFKKYNINVPLKTQGWINKALAKISYKESIGNYTYSYYSSSRNSTVFSEYLDQLVNAIKHAYNTITETEIAQEEIKQNEKQKQADYINNIPDICFKKCNNIIREHIDFRLLLRNGSRKEFTREEAEIIAKRAYKALKVENINSCVLKYMKRYDYIAKMELQFIKNNINISVEAIENNGKVTYLFIKHYNNKSDSYIYKEVA
jgi:hypothetical protein